MVMSSLAWFPACHARSRSNRGQARAIRTVGAPSANRKRQRLLEADPCMGERLSGHRGRWFDCTGAIATIATRSLVDNWRAIAQIPLPDGASSTPERED